MQESVTLKKSVWTVFRGDGNQELYSRSGDEEETAESEREEEETPETEREAEEAKDPQREAMEPEGEEESHDPAVTPEEPEGATGMGRSLDDVVSEQEQSEGERLAGEWVRASLKGLDHNLSR